VPTVIVQRGDAFYLSHLGVFPVVPGLEKIFRLSPSGALSVVADGFTTVLGWISIAAAGSMYWKAPAWPGSPRREPGA
jgi:hypothetical protein